MNDLTSYRAAPPVPSKVQELRDLLEKATRGPWQFSVVPSMGPDDDAPDFYIEASRGARIGMPLPDVTCVVDPEGGLLFEEDGLLIAALRNNADWLLERAEVAGEMVGALERAEQSLVSMLRWRLRMEFSDAQQIADLIDGSPVIVAVRAALSKAKGDGR